ncbi:MAG: biotin-dependent carboxyltransferase family protein [Clostridiales bacterium]|jgi:biotin-dependent carboxylase-like uncharacterized protein|nr:biotin-dependent carboxyltransferase family protein [Clostridiales bacterium]
MGLIINGAGPLSTIQDGGRIGYAEFGFQSSGAMDRRSFNIANLLVGNDKNQAAIEMTLLGIGCQFTSDAVIAITGADVSPMLNGVPIPRYQAVSVGAGDVLTSGFAACGCRAYLAVHGGFYLKKVMGSYSANIKCGIGGYMGRPLKRDDLLYFSTVNPKIPPEEIAKRRVDIPELPESPAEIRVVLGPQDDYFTAKGIETFLNSEYKLTNDSDRMGIKLDGEPVESKNGSDIISDGIPLGAVQIPASGKPIVMTADRQTAGGYAKIAVVISSDIPKLAQLKPGEALKFKEISLNEAQNVYLSELKYMEDLEKKFPKITV